MLFGLALLLVSLWSMVLPAMGATDWPKVCQQALGWSIDKPVKDKAVKVPSKKAPQGCSVDESCSGDIIASPKRYDMPNHEMPSHAVVVFVSFSMPEASLKTLSQEAAKHKAVLVMRGLFKDSFVKTSNKLHEMGVTVDINPPLFEQYRIDRVPVFIKLKKGKEVGRLSGNVSLEFAASKLKGIA